MRYCVIMGYLFTMLQHLDSAKLKAFGENQMNVAQMITSVFDRVENNVGKGENAGY